MPLNASAPHISLADWGLLILLSVIWGGSYLFVGIAVQDLPPLVIVMARVVIAASGLLALHAVLIGPLPGDRAAWTAIAGLSVLNNVIPFIMIVTGQTMIASGLASVINATSPLFGTAFIAAAGLERLSARKVTGLLAGLAGVVVLKAGAVFDGTSQWLGILLCLGAAASYGLGGLWTRMRLKAMAPLSAATGQLLCSSAIMLVIGFAFDRPSALLAASAESWLALLGLALLSTSFAYLVFFRVVARAGPANVLLVTMMIPVSAIAMGYAVIGERLDAQEVIGTLIIVAALVIIDGRALRRLWPRHEPA